MSAHRAVIIMFSWTRCARNALQTFVIVETGPRFVMRSRLRLSRPSLDRMGERQPKLLRMSHSMTAKRAIKGRPAHGRLIAIFAMI